MDLLKLSPLDGLFRVFPRGSIAIHSVLKFIPQVHSWSNTK